MSAGLKFVGHVCIGQKFVGQMSIGQKLDKCLLDKSWTNVCLVDVFTLNIADQLSFGQVFSVKCFSTKRCRTLNISLARCG